MSHKEIIKGLMIVVSKTNLELSSFQENKLFTLKEYKHYMQAYMAAEKLLKND